MNCTELESMLADYLGGELNPNQIVEVEHHLTGCSQCREEVESLRGIQGRVRGLPEVSLAQTKRAGADNEVRRRPSKWRRWMIAPLRYAAVLLLGLGLGWLIPLHPASSSMPEGDIASNHPVKQIVNAELPDGEVHPMWIEAGRRVEQLYSTQDSLARNLAIIAAVRSGS